MKFRLLFAFAVLVTAGIRCGPAQAFETYRVTSIPSGDTLKIREEPDEGGKLADWKEVGAIPSDATSVLGTGRTKLIGEQRWIEVVFGEKRGWVNLRFLEAADPADLKGETFTCAGTEPFWSVTLGPQGGEYSEPEATSTLTTERVQPSTARLFPLLYRLKDQNGRSVQATVSSQAWCSDGMSDHDYAFQVLLSTEGEFQQGCCVLKR